MRYISFNYSRLDRFRQAISVSYMVNVGLIYISSEIITPSKILGIKIPRNRITKDRLANTILVSLNTFPKENDRGSLTGTGKYGISLRVKWVERNVNARIANPA